MSNGNLGNVFDSLGEYHKAKEYEKKALDIPIETGDRKGEGRSNGSLGTAYHFWHQRVGKTNN